MQLRAWKETWMWLAVSACGGTPAWMTKTGGPNKASIYDAPPFANADYVATIEYNHERGGPPDVGLEHGRFQCNPLIRALDREAEFREVFDESGAKQLPREITQWTTTCDLEVGRRLHERTGFAFVLEKTGSRWYSRDELVAAATPIDTPSKALLVVWAQGTYSPGWGTSSNYYGTLDDGVVRAVPGGFEVVGTTSRTEADCGGSNRERVTVYRHVLFVDAKGGVTDRDQKVTNRYDVTDGCHPRGRRPSDFVDVAAGSLAEHVLRDMHHEAESVRAFERLARELAAYDAPAELREAALAAADEERDHALRCAALAGVDVEIASDALPVRSLLEIAIDNAREGCVGESYAALAAAVQARCAESAELRTHYAAIAVDELGHAALAHAIHSWIHTRLTDDERVLVAAARAAALEDLAPPHDTPLMRALGLPTSAFAERLVNLVAAVHRDDAGAAQA